MQTRRLFFVAALTLSALLPLASAPTDHKPAATTHTILIEGFKFVPERMEVAVGDTVVWKNEDIVPHTATAKKVFDSKGLDTGQSWSYVAKQKGTHPYICTFHPNHAR